MKSERVVIGIDPGLRGAICALDVAPSGSIQSVRLWKMPLKRVGKKLTNEVDVLALAALLAPLRSAAAPGGMAREAKVLIEEIIPMPKQGVIGTQTVGKNFGRLTACLEVLSFNYELVRPQKWQARIAELTKIPKGEGLNSKLQARLWVKAISSHELINELRHPTPHDGLVDAFLIAQSGV